MGLRLSNHRRRATNRAERLARRSADATVCDYNNPTQEMIDSIYGAPGSGHRQRYDDQPELTLGELTERLWVVSDA